LAPPDCPSLLEDWPSFLAEQKETAASRQRRLGLDAELVAAIPDFLDRHFDLERLDEGVSLLHTELMQDHLLVEALGDELQITGLYDFGDCLVGPPFYEFASVGLFVSAGDGAVLRTFFQSYGIDDEHIGPELSRELLAWTLLHRYANLPWYLRRMPVTIDDPTLDDLALRWFGL
jgi:hygromycin-B 7''-O-kinase